DIKGINGRQRQERGPDEVLYGVRRVIGQNSDFSQDWPKERDEYCRKYQPGQHFTYSVRVENLQSGNLGYNHDQPQNDEERIRDIARCLPCLVKRITTFPFALACAVVAQGKGCIPTVLVDNPSAV